MRKIHALLFFSFFFFGFARSYYLSDVKDIDFLNFSDKYVWITGRVLEEPRVTKDLSKFEIFVQLESVNFNGKVYRRNDRVLIFIDKSLGRFKKRDVISTFTKLIEPEFEKYENGFSYKQYLKQKSVRLISFSKNIVKVKSGRMNFFDKFVARFRQIIENFEDAFFSDDELKSMFHSILLGEQRTISVLFREEIIKAGLAHLVSFSGIKLAIFLSVLKRFFMFLKLRPRIVNFFLVLLLFFVRSICQKSVVVDYSILYNGLNLFAIFFERESDVLNSNIIVLLFLLIWNPFYIQNSGLILSVASCVSIIFFADKIGNKLKFIDKRLNISVSKHLSTNISVFIGTFWLIIYFFNVSSCLILINNFLINFIINYVFSMGLSLILINSLFPKFSLYLRNLIIWPLKLARIFIKRISICDWLWRSVKTPKEITFIVYLFFLIFLYKALSYEKEKIES